MRKGLAIAVLLLAGELMVHPGVAASAAVVGVVGRSRRKPPLSAFAKPPHWQLLA
jgi:hypothetical protein